MRIIIAADTYYPSVDGSSFFTQRLSGALKALGHDVLVFAPSTTWKNTMQVRDGVRIYGVASLPTFLHKDYRFVPPLFLNNKIKKEIEKFHPDIIHIQGHFFLEAAVFKIGRALGVPVLGTNHFMPENLLHYAKLPKIFENLLKKIMWQHFIFVFKKLELLTTPTKTARTILRGIGLENEVRVISCGIDLDKFNPRNNGEYLRSIYKLPKRPLLLSVSRLAPEKNIDSNLKAAAIALKKIDFQLVIAGSGMERKRLEELAVKLGIRSKVSFLGYVKDDDLPNLYSIADAFIMAGTVELQSIATMEAMASGLPVLAADALALPELVQHGKNGYLFDPNNYLELANYIYLILKDSSKMVTMAANSLKIAKDHDINKVVDQFLGLYEELRCERVSEYLYR